MKKSKLWSVTTEEMQKVIDECSSMGEVIERFGLTRNGNYQTLYRRIKHDKLDVDGLRYRSRFVNRSHIRKHQNSDIFCENSSIATSTIMKRV